MVIIMFVVLLAAVVFLAAASLARVPPRAALALVAAGPSPAAVAAAAARVSAALRPYRGAIALGLVFVFVLGFRQVVLAQGPWADAVKQLCLAFTGIIGRGLALVAIVIGGLMYAFGEGGSKSQIAGLVFGAGLVLGAIQFIQWVGLDPTMMVKATCT